MKMTRRGFLNISTAAAVVCAATLLPVEKAAAAQQTMAAQELLEQAYLYAFPLVLMDATRKVSTTQKHRTIPVRRSTSSSMRKSWQTPHLAQSSRRMWIPSIRRHFSMSAQNRCFTVYRRRTDFSMYRCWMRGQIPLQCWKHRAFTRSPARTGRANCRKGCSGSMCRPIWSGPVSYTHLRAHETDSYLVCRLLLEKKKYTSQRD